MRIYEYAKNNKKTSKELLSLLEEGGFDFPSHMSVMTDESISFLDEKLSVSIGKKDVVLKKIEKNNLIDNWDEEANSNWIGFWNLIFHSGENM